MNTMASTVKKRLDQLLLERELAPSRQRARAVIMAGNVLVANEPVSKPGVLVPEEAEITVKESCPYVSRGGLKLAGALQSYELDVSGLTCLDVGASTGGFTDCLLHHGARHVYAVDVGYGQFAWQLRNDDRVTVIERTNIRHMPAGAIPERMDLAVIDVSFISLTIVIPAVLPFLKPSGRILALIKPQFEIGKGRVGKGGVVRDAADHREVLDDLARFAEKQGLSCDTAIRSPITGPKGNIEFFNMFTLDFSQNKR